MLMKTIDEKAFRKAMGKFATGVTIMTCRAEDDRAVGMTVNSFTSVSLEPPLVSRCVNRQIIPTPAFGQTGHFAVHVLHRDQEELSNHFAVDREDKFDGIEHDNGIAGTPILTDFLAVYQCEVSDRIDAGDHFILVGKLVDYEIRDGEPLIFHQGRYHSLA
ncbi:MAG: flavin reductase family protein [Woeseiaceae bacterium]|nr:flavin reductase family protein [Woeseiaceae bacterium]